MPKHKHPDWVHGSRTADQPFAKCCGVNEGRPCTEARPSATTASKAWYPVDVPHNEAVNQAAEEDDEDASPRTCHGTCQQMPIPVQGRFARRLREQRRGEDDAIHLHLCHACYNRALRSFRSSALTKCMGTCHAFTNFSQMRFWTCVQVKTRE
jgi:hypothetical protein